MLYRQKDELLNALETLRLHPNWRRQLGEKGYAAFIAHWEEEQYLENYFKLIAEIAEKKHVAPDTWPNMPRPFESDIKVG
jgi:hypothetical protein